MKKLVGLLVFSCVFLGVITFFASTATAERGVTDDSIRIGILGDRTGPIANSTAPMVAGSKNYFKWINLKGGVHGRKFLISEGDTQYRIPKCVFEVKRLVNEEEVFMLCPGCEITGGFVGVLPPLFEELNVPVFTTVPSRYCSMPPKRLLFSPSAIRTWQAQVMFDYVMHDLKFKSKNPKIGMIYPDIAYGHLILEAVQDRRKFYGIKDEDFVPIVFNLSEPSGVTQVMELKKAKVDVVFIAEIHSPAAKFLKASFSYGFHPVMVGCSSEVSIDGIISLVGNPKAFEKFYGLHMYAAPDESCPGCEELMQMAEKFPEVKKFVSDRFFTGGLMLAKMAVEGFRRAGRDLTVDSFVSAMESFKDFDTGGLHAPITFGPNKRYGSTGAAVLTYDMKTNRFKKITKIRTPRETP